MSATDSPAPASSVETPAASAPAPTEGVKATEAPSEGAAAAAAATPAGDAPASEASTTPAPSSATTATGPSPSTSLYVGELDPTVTEAMLYEIFSMVGPVASIRVCRDAVTRRSLGYSYVNYLNANDGERALEQLNYSLIKNRPCRIMWSQRDPALRKTGAGNIFIKNLDENIDNKALHDTFAAFGNILSCKVAVDGQTGASLGYGFVHYDDGTAAQAAIEGVNGMLLNDKVVFVGLHVPKRERQAKIEEVRANYTNLYVKNIPLDVTQDEFKALFDKFGNVTSAVITVDEEGKSKGFGFVNYDGHDAAHKALTELHENDFRGQQLFVTRAQRKNEREEELKKSYEQKKYETTLKYQGVNLYVKNLDDDVSEEKLQAEFEPFGQITSCKIMVDEKGVSKGFGFVCFSAPDEATKAVTELNGKMIGSKPLYVSLAQRKDVRKQQLEAQVAQRNQIRTQQIQASGIPGIPPFMGQPMYYPGPQGYPQPGARGPMGYPQPGPNGMPRPRYFPGMPGMPMPPMAGPGQPQYGQYPPPPAGQMRGAPRPGGPPPAGLPNRPQAPGQPMSNGPAPRNGAPLPPNGAPRPPQAQPPRAPAGAPRVGGYQGGNKAREAEQQAANGSGLTAAVLANAAPQEQKQMLGEALYPKIHQSEPALAGKITGMLLEMDSAEVLYLLENDDALEGKIKEALDVLDEFSRRSAAEETA